MSAPLVLLALDGERVWAAPPGRPAAAMVVGWVVRSWRAWDGFDPDGAWVGAYRSRYAAAHALVDHAAERDRARARSGHRPPGGGRP